MKRTPPCRHDWTLEELQDFYTLPLLDLVFQSATIHRVHHDPSKIQVCKIISIKTGGCQEDCAYCAQSSRYKTSTRAEPMMDVDEVLSTAKKAVDSGATRICLAAGWREIRANKPFEQIIKMVQGIKAMGVEVCCTLGMLKEAEAEKLAEAGLYAYNHNIDTSERFYPEIITTRTFKDRLNTLDIVEKCSIGVCCGGIIGMGEAIEDRLLMLQTLSNRPHHPESVPINVLSRVPGTPLARQKKIEAWELIRLVAIARIVMPKAMVRLSSGRNQLTQAEQAFCFLAGANSIHTGEKLLTVAAPSFDEDDALLSILGLKKRPPYDPSSVSQE